MREGRRRMMGGLKQERCRGNLSETEKGKKQK